MHVYVGGETATNADFAAVIAPKLLIFIGVVLVLGFVLLTLAFRSLLIPAVAAVMNLLAAAASFGVLVAVFQYGWGLRLLNLGQAGPIESFLPVLMLAVLFGLSMDYEVFLVSRIREEWAATGDNHQAVRTGQATTGRVIIAAATIMILVFSAFILSGQQTIGEIGIGLAAAVLLDAFLLRTLLVLALMHLSGRANWWLPGWLDRALPHLSIELVVGRADPDAALGGGLQGVGEGLDARVGAGQPRDADFGVVQQPPRGGHAERSKRVLAARDRTASDFGHLSSDDDVGTRCRESQDVGGLPNIGVVQAAFEQRLYHG
jgi:MMPL family